MIRRTTADQIRVTVENGIAYLGFDAINRKPLNPAEVATFCESIGACDASEAKKVLDLCRKHQSPGNVWKALEAKRSK